MFASFLAAALAVSPSPGVNWLELRRDLVRSIWPDSGGKLPTASTPTVGPVPVKGFPDLSNLTWQLSCPFFYLNSTVYHSVRTAGSISDTVVIHHHGHAKACDKTLPDNRCDSNRSFYDYYNVTDYYHRVLEADAFFLYMPLFGPNEQQGLPESHVWFEQWQEKGVATVSFFLEPVIRTINFALGLGYKNVVMIGKSGGGWTTTLAAAIDPRIGLSFPIAGSIPLDFPHKSWDFEQMPRNDTAEHPWYLSVANYTQLYALATVDGGGGRTRSSLQVLHENDPCCYYGKGRHAGILAYDRAVMAELPAPRQTNKSSQTNGGGMFSTAITDWNVHAVCQMDRAVIAAAKKTVEAGEPNFEALPCDILRAASLPCPYKPPESLVDEI